MSARRRSFDVREGVRDVPLRSWEDFADYIRDEHRLCRALIYRGQADAAWPVLSRLDRHARKYPTKRVPVGNTVQVIPGPPATSAEHLRAFQQAALGKRGPNPPELTEDEWWALAQHHGLATPMLDWTLAPFVALFFAFEDARVPARTGRPKAPRRRAVWTLSMSCIESGQGDEDVAPRVYGPMKDLTPRLANQSGVFLRMPHGLELERYVRNRFAEENTAIQGDVAGATLERITMPDRGRVECLQLLNKMNINRATLFPDLDGAAHYVNALWALDFDTALGHLPASIPAQG